MVSHIEQCAVKQQRHMQTSHLPRCTSLNDVTNNTTAHHITAKFAEQALQADDMPNLMTTLGSASCAHSHKHLGCVVDQFGRQIVDQRCATPGWPFQNGSPVKIVTI